MDRADQVRRVDQLLDLDPDRVAVVLVDFQRDFCDPPGLDPRQAGTTSNARTAQRANTFAAQAADLGVRTIYTQQFLDLDRLTTRQRRWEQASQLCVAGTAGAELYLPPVPAAQVVRKYRFDIWQSHQFLDLLTRWNIDGMVIGGVELQCCVLYAVLGAEERGFHYVVPQDLVSGLDRCETTTNQAIRDYLRHAHPSPATADTLLAGWRHRRDGPAQLTPYRSSRSRPP